MFDLNTMIEATGYRPKTTFWQDFTIADAFGPDAVRDTYRRAFREWKTDCTYLTELAMVLNWKAWQHADTNEELCRLYARLWGDTDEYACDHLKGEELSYYYQTTD